MGRLPLTVSRDGRAVATLSDTEFEISLGQDNLIRISDADDEIEVDLDIIINEAAEAVRMACEELEAGEPKP